MSKIKTKESMVSRGVKTIDKAAVAAQRRKSALVSIRQKESDATEDHYENIEEFASEHIQQEANEATAQAASAGEHVISKTGNFIKNKTEDPRIDSQQSSPAQQGTGIETPESSGRRTAQFKTDTQTPANTQYAAAKAPPGYTERGAEKFKADTQRRMKEKAQPIKTVEHDKKTIRQSARSAGKLTIKKPQRAATKVADRSVKTAQKTGKAAIKTAKEAEKQTRKAARNAEKASRKAVQVARQTTEMIKKASKAAVETVKKIVTAIIAAVKSLGAAIAAGGTTAVIVIVILALVGLLVGSIFGIFFSGEDSGYGISLQDAVSQINMEYNERIQFERQNYVCDVVEMRGSRAQWKDVLAVYAVKTYTDPENPQDVATLDDQKVGLLSCIFWEMHQVSSWSEIKDETILQEVTDEEGNLSTVETTVTRTYLYITVTHSTPEEMADIYGFDEQQREYLAELLDDQTNSMWSQALYGIPYGSGDIVEVALSQVGNVGGEPYWSWYGFDSRVDWCCIFVSWCAYQCGYIDDGVIPRFAVTDVGEEWFKSRGQWIDGSAEPVPGMIIFFDYYEDGTGQDGDPEHVGIVEKVENGYVYTVEGNSGDSCRNNYYPLGDFEIMGYGVPAY